MTRSIPLFVLLTACTESPGPDLSCVKEADVRTAAYLADGIVLDEIGGLPIAGATIAVRTTDGALLAEAVSDQAGRYGMSGLVHGPVVRHAYTPGYLATHAYDPAGSSALLPLPMLERVASEDLYSLAGVPLDRSKGLVLAIVQDCGGRPVEGATIAGAGAEAVLYLDANTQFDPSLAATSTNSAALLLGAPVGPVEIEVELDGVAFAPAIVDSRPDTLSVLWRRPGG